MGQQPRRLSTLELVIFTDWIVPTGDFKRFARGTCRHKAGTGEGRLGSASPTN